MIHDVATDKPIEIPLNCDIQIQSEMKILENLFELELKSIRKLTNGKSNVN